MVARNWLTTLWPSSFKGVPFWSERTQEMGGRRVVEHEFPMRDEPFLEDLGEALRKFDVTAYVASDSADAEAAALAAVCAARGPGLLVLPVQGQVLVRCLEFARDHEKDRLGYIAFNLKCTREGASFSIASVASLANLVFLAADALSIASAFSFARSFLTNGLGSLQLPFVDFVVGAAEDALRDGVAVLEAIRTSEPVETIASARQRDAIQLLFDEIPAILADPATSGLTAGGLVSIARALGDAMPPATALRAFEAILTDQSYSSMLAPNYPTLNLKAAAINQAAAHKALRLAALAAYSEAVPRLDLEDRPSAITIRANIAEYFEAELELLPAAESELARTLTATRDAVVDYLSRAILDLAPVMNVEANLSMPSLFWAWRLYQDPSRSTEIVGRNRVPHPSFMPTLFEALAR